MSSTERSLADQDLTPVQTIDTTPVQTPADFSMAAFLEGVRPTRRSVQLFPQAHLIGRLEQLAARIEVTDDGPEVDALVDEFEQVKAQFRDGIWFTVEKRSSEWVDHFREATAKSLGIKNLSQDDEEAEYSTADAITLALHQVAAQTVAPSGVTYEHLRQLLDTNEGEFRKLLQAMTEANKVLAENAQVLTRDFSLRRSAPSAT